MLSQKKAAYKFVVATLLDHDENQTHRNTGTCLAPSEEQVGICLGEILIS